MKHISILTLMIVLCSQVVKAQTTTVDYVDPLIGTGGHGHTFPGPTMPFGMVQLSPDTRLVGWDGCSGYHYTDSVVYGFSHTHLSGTGVSDYGDVLLMPFTGETQFQNGADGRPGYSSPFNKDKEVAKAGYYKTHLEDYAIDVELTTTLRTGLHRYTFPIGIEQKVMLDLVHRDMVTESYFHQVSETEIEGYRYSKAWAEDQKLHFSIKFNRVIQSTELEVDGQMSAAVQEVNSRAIRSALTFAPSDKPLMVQVGISFVDIAGARQNLETEFAGWDFEAAVTANQAAWQKVLGKIEVTSSDSDKLVVFYSALYHTMIAPNLFSDVDGRYLGTDLAIHHAGLGHEQYTIFSLWDTYRATHPLYTIIDQERTTHFVNTFLNQYKQGGRLPMWELAGNYTGCMIGYHAVPVISDAYIKGIRGFDAELALTAMMASATAQRLGIPDYIASGFLPGEAEAECVSKTLEYAYDDWTIAVMAQKMGKKSIAQEYFQRGQYYKNVLDPETGFMRARLNNRWFHPFDPAEVNFNYTEANAWQYSYYVPQDIEGWKQLIGGDIGLSQKLDALFAAESETIGRHQVDITGLIGQYAHGNEPSHHIAYLYNYCGESHKTQALTRQIMDELYSIQPDGYSGNEDCGQMSAWLVMSAMGFYPVTPGSEDYVLGSPWLDSVIIHLENGKTFTINAENNQDSSPYIATMQLNGTDYSKTYVTHSDILNGGNLDITMSPEPNTRFSQAITDRPVSKIESMPIVAVPAVMSGSKAFFGQTEVVLSTITPDAQIKYTINQGEIREYTQPIRITSDAELEVWASKPGHIDSKTARSSFLKMEEDRTIKLETQYGNHYAAGGDKALIDYIKGGNDYRTGAWQGYEGVDLIATIDLGKQKALSTISINFLQDENSWIFMPSEVEFYYAKNGKKFHKLATTTTQITPKDKGTIIADFTVHGDFKARYIKVVGKTLGICPDYHKGAGGKCWIFADEITIE